MNKFVIIIFVIAIPFPALCNGALPAEADTTRLAVERDSVRSREDQADDSLMALRKTFNAYRLTFGFGGDFQYGGSAGMYSLSYQHNHYLFTGEYLASGTSSFLGSYGPGEYANEYGVLFGYANISRYLFFSASAGVGYAKFEKDGNQLDSTSLTGYVQQFSHSVTMPLQVQGMVTFSNIFGIGFMMYGTLSPATTISRTGLTNFGLTLNMQFGSWSMTQGQAQGADVESEDEDEKKYEGERKALNSVYLEFGGAGLLFSANYDRVLGPHTSISGGVAYTPDEMPVPVMFHYFFMPRNSGLDLGLGVAPIFFLAHQSDSRQIYFTASASIAFRYQAFNGGEFIHIGITPLYDFTDKLFDPFSLEFGGGITF